MDSTQQPAGGAGTIQIGSFTVNRMGYGAMRLTGPGITGAPKDRENAQQVLRRAVELGINFIDTADAYGPATNEQLIADTLRPYRGIVIATKGGSTRDAEGNWARDGSRRHLRQACEASLKRLGVETIDIYQLHWPDSHTPYHESIEALVELQKEGKIKHIGVSNVSLEQLKTALQIAPIVSVQNSYNLLARQSEAILKFCAQNGIVFIPYFPMGGRDSALDTAGHQLLMSIASKYHASPRQIALAWLLGHSPVILPIPGTASLEHLEQNVHAATLALTVEEQEALDGLTI